MFYSKTRLVVQPNSAFSKSDSSNRIVLFLLFKHSHENISFLFFLLVFTFVIFGIFVQPLWIILQRFLKKLKIILPHDIAIPLLGIYLKRMKSLSQRAICTLIFIITALFTIAKIQKQPKSSLMDKWLRKYYTHTHLHTYSGILSSHKTNKMLPFAKHGWTLRALG